jgi:mono/diheme cytochrome c family protein
VAPFFRRVARVAGLLLAVVAVVAAAVAVYVQLTWDRPLKRPVRPMAAPHGAPQLARGEYLYRQSLLCWVCHGSQGSRSPDEPQAGGREFDMTGIGPGFGFVYGSNLTPDSETGIGAWSDGELVRAIREGISRTGGVIFPVMAYQFYHGLSDDDALAVVAYLRSRPPVRHEVPRRRLSFAAKALHAIGVINAEAPITSRVEMPRRDAVAEYGAYVAWHTAGCAECHTPRDPRTARLDLTRPLGGGLFPFPEPGFSTTGGNLTPDAASGIRGWTEEQFVAAMRTGVRPDGTVMLPFMPWPSYATWTRDDLHAVWVYLRTLKPVSHRVPATMLTGAAAGTAGLSRGETIYDAYCLTCHGARGAGAPFTSAALRDAVRGLDEQSIARFVADGIPGTNMPAFARTLRSEQITDIAAYIRAW